MAAALAPAMQKLGSFLENEVVKNFTAGIEKLAIVHCNWSVWSEQLDEVIQSGGLCEIGDADIEEPPVERADITRCDERYHVPSERGMMPCAVCLHVSV